MVFGNQTYIEFTIFKISQSKAKVLQQGNGRSERILNQSHGKNKIIWYLMLYTITSDASHKWCSYSNGSSQDESHHHSL